MITPEQDHKYESWVEESLKLLPDLAARVFALRNKSYMGCGYHYALEEKLGKVICNLNNTDYYRKDDKGVIAFRCCTRVLLKVLIDGIEKAEKENIK